MDTLRPLIFRPLRVVAKNRRCSRLHSPKSLSRLLGCFDVNHLRRFSSQNLIKAKEHTIKVCSFTWWEMVDSNHRRRSQQIYSLSPLATREISHIKFYTKNSWSWWTDSNPRPADYKSAALPTELHQHFSAPD